MADPTLETSIWLAIKGRIETLPFAPKIPIAYPASIYEPTGAPFIAVGRVSIAPVRILIGHGPHDRTGTLTLSYVAPLGQDVSVYDDIAGRIAAHFPADLQMRFRGVCVRVREAPHKVDGYRDDGWWRTPVNVRWRCLS